MDINHNIPVLELDSAAIGSVLTWLPAISAMLRHESLRATLDYGCPEAAAHPREAEFVSDLLTMSTEEIAGKWYGGLANASAFASAASALAASAHRTR